MASKSNKMNKAIYLHKMNKAIYLHALLGLFAGVVFSSCFHGIPMNLEEELNSARLTQGFVEIQDTATRRIQDGLITLSVKFLHFFLSRSLQFRHLSAAATTFFYFTTVLGSIYSIGFFHVRRPPFVIR